MSDWKCPFCDGRGKSSKEHVWAKWLHETPGAKQLLEGSSGERMPLEWGAMKLGADGRFESEAQRQGHWARLLPNVTVRVCSDCNGGWMSGLEADAKRIVGPLVLRGERVWLGPEEQRVLARWAVKTFMAYALTLGPIENPFSLNDYRQVSSTNEMPERIHVWMAHVDSRMAQVGLVIHPTAFMSDFDPVRDQNNAALGFLAAGGLVFLLVLLPENLEGLTELLSPPGSSAGGTVHRLTLPQAVVALTIPAWGEEYMANVTSWVESLKAVAMPAAEDLSPEELREASQLFRDGVSPAAIRSLHPGSSLTPEFVQKAAIHEQDATDEASRYVQAGDFKGAGIVLTHRGKEHFDRGDFEGAGRLLIAAIESRGSGLSNDAESAYRVGQCYWHIQDPRAENWYQRAIDLGLDAPEPRFGIVDTRARLGRYGEALEMLNAIVPATLEHTAVLSIAIPAFDFVVHELGVAIQDRRDVEPHELNEDLAPEQLEVLLKSTDAINRGLWRQLDVEDDRVQLQFARAWFGDEPVSWMAATVAVAEHESTEVAEAVFRLGLNRIIELLQVAEVTLGVFSEIGMADHPGVVTVRRVLDGL